MNPTIKARIESIRRGEVPEGYKRTKIGIVPNEWKEYNLGDFLEEYKEKTMISNQYPVLTSSRKGLMLQKEYYSRRQVTTDDNIGYNVIPFGFITYRSRSDDGRFCFNENTIIEKGIISYFYPVFSVSANAVKTFVLYLMNETIYRRMIPYAEGTAQQVLSLKQLCSLKYFFPTVSEQEKIAEILAGQDRVIALKEKLLAEKQKQKKYLMQQLLTGKKRLPGFSGEWKSVHLGELGLFYQPQTLSQREIDTQKGYPVYGANGVIGFYKKYNHEFPQIIITCRGSTCGTVGITVEKSWINGNAMVFNLDSNQNVDKLYMFYLCASFDFRKIITGSGQPQIVREPLQQWQTKMPSLTEQTAIAEILSTADKEIELLKKDIKQEKLKKKSLMQLLLTGIVRVL